jgi:hypothetical protein
MTFVCRTTSFYILHLSFSRARPDSISFLLSPNVLLSPPNNLPPCLKNNSLPALPTFNISWPRTLLINDCPPTPQLRDLPIPVRPYPLSNQSSNPRSFPSLPPHATAPAPTRVPTSSTGLSYERTLGNCTVLHTDTFLDDDNIRWHTLAFTSSKSPDEDSVVAKVSEVRNWCRKGKPPVPIVNIPVPPTLQQQPESTSPFRAILHPPKTCPPPTTHQYATRSRKLFSMIIHTHRNTKTNTSRPVDPHRDPPPQYPNAPYHTHTNSNSYSNSNSNASPPSRLTPTSPLQSPHPTLTHPR